MLSTITTAQPARTDRTSPTLQVLPAGDLVEADMAVWMTRMAANPESMRAAAADRPGRAGLVGGLVDLATFVRDTVPATPQYV